MGIITFSDLLPNNMESPGNETSRWYVRCWLFTRGYTLQVCGEELQLFYRGKDPFLLAHIIVGVHVVFPIQPMRAAGVPSTQKM